jgi:ABC-type Fe3+ transport system substrate-binding protein
MGRHADPAARRRVPAVTVLIAAAVAVGLLAGGVTWWLVGSGGCDDRRTVALTVAPELGDLTERLLADPLPLDDGGCAVAEVTAQEPLQTVGNLGALDAEAVPDVWVPDSSLWVARAGEAALEGAGSMASSPVVLATSRATADALGWTGQAPTWAAALSAGRPLAVPDLAASAEGLSALAAVRTSLGGGEAGDTAVVQAVLAAARAAGPGPAEALETASSGSPEAALVPVSEQEVFAANAGTEDPALVAVYPSEGSPVLGYPVLRVGSPSGQDRAAVDAVVRALTSERARDAVLGAGFRTPDGTAPAGAGPGTGTVEAAPTELPLDAAEVQGLLARLSSLAAPSRLLAVFDMSTSMKAVVGDGTRATLARDAAKSALTLFPESSAIGLWGFARKLNGDTDWIELVPTRGLAADAGGRTQRDAIREQLDSIPERLAPGGTGLYDTTLAAVRAARADYDPTAVSSVVIVTDGKDEDDDSIGLGPLVETLRAEVDPTRPVKVIGIALGPDADLGSLQEIAAATGGAAYSAVDENDLQSVLFDALRQRG